MIEYSSYNNAIEVQNSFSFNFTHNELNTSITKYYKEMLMAMIHKF